MVAGFFKIKFVCFIVTIIKIANIFYSETIYALSCDGKNMCAFSTQWIGLKLHGKYYTRLQRNQIYIFSSAADIVSGDYPMQNRPLWLSSIRSVLYLQMEEYISTNWSPGNGWNSMESEQWFRWVWPKVNQARGGPYGVCTTNLI